MQKNKLIFQPIKCLSQEDFRLYLSGALDNPSRHRVENHLLDCPLCAEAMEGFSGGGYDFDKETQLVELKNAIKEKTGVSKKNSRAIFWTLNRIAAAILFIIIATAAFVYWNIQSSERTFLAELESSKDLIENVRGSEDFPDGNQYQDGLELYQKENYRESLLFFDQILESQPENVVAHYFAGLSALNLGELNKAIENLSYVRFNDEKYYEGATWNLVLANVGLGNKEEAIVLLGELLKIEGGYYSEKAEKLLKKLEEK